MAESVLFGRYRLLEPAGSGGSASVWRAIDERTGEEVAVKRLHPLVVADEAARRRLRREFRALRRLGGPNVARVRDLHVEDGDAAIVLEYVAGRSLADRLAGGEPVPPREAVAIASDVCAALASAHDAGIVHRDVTPGNILLDEDGRARLTDFGIALGGDDGPARTVVTGTGLVVGTPRYVSPEQLRGAPATPASDLFSLAAVVYEMLAGRPAFAATAPVALAEEQVAGPPPIEGVPEPLDAAVRQALSIDPANRPADVDAFAASLEAAIGEDLGRAVTTVMPAVGAPAANGAASGTTVASGPPWAGTAAGSSGTAGEPRASARGAQALSDRLVARAPLAVLGVLVLALATLAVATSNGTFLDPSDAGRAAPSAVTPAAAEPTPVASPTPAAVDSAAPAVGAGDGGGKGKGNGGGKGKGKPPGKDD